MNNGYADNELQENPVKIDSRNKSHHIKNNHEFFLNDINFLPVYEIKRLKDNDDHTFDIYKDRELDPDEDSENNVFNIWDSSLSIDYKKLQKYIQFQVNIMTTKNGKTSNLITEFKNCQK